MFTEKKFYDYYEKLVEDAVDKSAQTAKVQ